MRAQRPRHEFHDDTPPVRIEPEIVFHDVENEIINNATLPEDNEGKLNAFIERASVSDILGSMRIDKIGRGAGGEGVWKTERERKKMTKGMSRREIGYNGNDVIEIDELPR